MRVRTTSEWVDLGEGRGRHTYHPIDDENDEHGPVRRRVRIDRELAMGRPVEGYRDAPPQGLRLADLTKDDAKLKVTQKLTPGVPAKRQTKSDRKWRHGG